MLIEAEVGVIGLLEGEISQGMWAASRIWKKQGTDSPLEIPEGTQPCRHLDFSPLRPILELLFLFHNSERIHLCSYKLLSLSLFKAFG